MTALAPWHNDFPGSLAGSVYAAPGSRVVAAQTLAEAGLDVHIDVMAASEGLPAGVSLAELQMISAVVERTRIGVHLIGSPDFVDAVLPKILPLRPGAVFLPWQAFTEERADAVRAADGAAWIAVWQEWDGHGTPSWPAAPDGVLVMLIQPGTRDKCSLGQLNVVEACAAELPVAVDGGVTEAVAPLCLSAGAQFLVVGRSLLLDASDSDAPQPLSTQRRTS
ncbi:ribulose phosphate epimerase [Mycolicibacterium komossense]|uniref:Ribulose phosphate epimerase n=1 Tax=Mycolicibacterium komossense TaxID=1779 RepID=A0ABT3CH40_9MYCO|nr:ribulose phosphate epimerase [Mycolicibacterium komossense]MCV7228785.1 ribulose phosphate epimerase [Mycolicibacterium komossense]